MTRPAFSRGQRLAIAERDDWICNPRHGDGCAKLVEPNSNWQADHILPDGLGGATTVENGQLLCYECHQTKTHGRDNPKMYKADRQRAEHEAHQDAMKRGERRQSKLELRRAAMTANRPEPLAERVTTEVDG